MAPRRDGAPGRRARDRGADQVRWLWSVLALLLGRGRRDAAARRGGRAAAARPAPGAVAARRERRARAARRSRRSRRSPSSSSTSSTGSPPRRSCSASRSGSRSRSSPRRRSSTSRRLVPVEEISEPYSEPEHRPSRRRSFRSSRSPATDHAAPPAEARRGRSGRDARRCAIVPAASLGPVGDPDVLRRSPWRRGLGWWTREGRPIWAHHIEEDAFYTAFPQGALARASSARRSSSCASSPGKLDLRPAASRDWAPGRDRRLLEDLHARGLRGRALPRAALRADVGARRRSSARATTRRSTRRPAPASSSAPPAARSRSSRSSSTPTARCVPEATSAALSAQAGGESGGSRRRAPRTRRPPRTLRDDSRRRSVPRLADRCRAVREEGAPVRLPRPLVVPARRDRDVLVPRPRRDGDLPGALLRAVAREDGLPRHVRAAPGRPDDGRVQVGVDLSFDVKAGLLFRQTHHWAANVFVVSIVLHVWRVFFTGAFRKPRELVYYVGILMLMLALLEGYLGYSLLDDLLSGMGLAIGNAVALSIPFVGGNLAALDLGRAVPGRRRVLVADVHRPRPPDPGRNRDAARAAPRADRRAPPHAVPRPRHTRSAASPACPRSRATRRGRSASRSPSPAVLFLLGGLVQINPIWLWGPYEVVAGDERRAAGLVPRLADRRAAADAGVRRRDRQLHARPERVLGRRALPAARVRRSCSPGRRSSGASPATTGTTICSTARATILGGPRSAPRS